MSEDARTPECGPAEEPDKEPEQRSDEQEKKGEPGEGASAAEHATKEDGTEKICPHCKRAFADVRRFHAHVCRDPRGAVAPRPRPMQASDGIAALARFVYTHNPFYLVSVGLVLYGVSLAFKGGTDDATRYAWMLLGTLAGYSALLGITAVVIVRLGKVWDDARTIILAMTILIVALSGSFDQLVMEHPSTGIPVLLVGLVFTSALSEALMRGAGIRMPGLFRGPYHTMLALLFFYPLVLLGLLRITGATKNVPVSWGLFLFPVAAAVAFLSLVPAVRRGSQYVKQNGTPWRWPWFPWALFGLLALAVAFRSYWLTISFYPAKGMLSPWGAYFLAPMMFAAAVLLLEIAVASGKERLKDAALAIPILALAISFPGSGGNAPYRAMRTVLVEGLASPAYLATLAAIAFYVYAWLRKARLAEVGLVISLAAACVVRTHTIHQDSILGPHPLPLGVICLLLAVQALRRRMSLRALLAWTSVVFALTVFAEQTWFTRAGCIVPLHLFFAGALVIGLVFRDRFARVIQNASAVVLAVTFAIALALGGGLAPGLPRWVFALYLGGLFLLAPAYWSVSKNANYFRVFLVNTTLLLAGLVVSVFRYLARPGKVKGIGLIFGGGLAFAVAAVISFVKAGVLRGAVAKIADLAGLTRVLRPVARRAQTPATNRATSVWKALIVLLALLVLAGLLLPALATSRERARRTRCASNLKQIGYGLHLYSADHDDQFPAAFNALYPVYISDMRVFVCPSGLGGKGAYVDPPAGRFSEEHVSYCYVSGLTAADDSSHILAFDEAWNHGGIGVNVLYVANNVDWQRDIKELHERLRKQLAELEFEGRKVRVLRPPWSRWPERPGVRLRALCRREPSAAAVLVSAGLLLALDMGLFAAWLVRRRRRGEG